MENFGFNFYDPNPAAIYRTMDTLNRKFPFLEKKNFGKSVMSQDMTALFMGSGDRTLLVCAGQHSNEYLGVLALLRFINGLASAYAKNDLYFGFDPKKILSRMRFCFAPMTNPDGLALVIGELYSGAYYNNAVKISNNFSKIPFPTGWKANIQGIDLNLQYPAGWEKAVKIKAALGYDQPAPWNFPGYAPLSAPESAALAKLTQEQSPKILIALHSQGQVIYSSHGEFAPPGSLELGEKMAAASGYALVETPPESDNAGIKDWFVEKFNRPGYTFELGLGENPLPIWQLDGIYQELSPMLMLAADEIAGTL